MFTLLRHEDVKHFKGMLRKADNTYVRDYKLGRERMAGLLPDVEQALLKMQVGRPGPEATARPGATSWRAWC